MKNFTILGWIAYVLVLIGGINWGFYGIFKLDLVSVILGNHWFFSRVAQILIGIAAGYLIYRIFKRKPEI